ncbi:MAG: hypothetical protein ACRCS3_15905, partial [Paracoccaceae bacterium]
IGRGTSFALRHLAHDPVALGKMIRVAYLVTGHAVRHGTQFRLHVDLMDCTDGHILWSNTYMMAADEVMRAADSLPDPIVAAIAREVSLTEQRRAAMAPTSLPPDAWLSFHKGLNLIFHTDDGEMTSALEQFTAAATLDPGFSRAHAFISFCHYSFAMGDVGPSRQNAMQAALTASRTALHRDEISPAAHWAHGRALWLNHDPVSGLRHIREAVTLCPSFPQAHYMAGFIEAHQGDPARALDDLAVAESLSPFDPFLASMQVARATALVRLGDYEGAVDMASRATQHASTVDILQCYAAFILAGLDQVDQAAAVMAKAPQNEPVFQPQMVFTTIYDMPADMRRLLEKGAAALEKVR